MKINFGSKKEQQGDFTPLPNGVYQLKVDTVELNKNNKGLLQIECKHTVLGPKYVNRKLFDRFVLKQPGSKGAEWKINQLLESAEKEPFYGELDTDDVIKAMQGSLIYASVEETSWTSKKDGSTQEGNNIGNYLTEEKAKEMVELYGQSSVELEGTPISSASPF